MSELLPCPFCGAKPIIDDSYLTCGDDSRLWLVSAECPQCGDVYFNAVGPTFEDAKEKVFSKWNTRHERTCYLMRNEDRSVFKPIGYCSACGGHWDEIYDYCPWCGAEVM